MRNDEALAERLVKSGKEELSFFEKIHPGKAVGLAGITAITGFALASLGHKGPSERAQAEMTRRAETGSQHTVV